MKSTLTSQNILKPKIKIEYGDDYKFVQDIVSSNNLHTVCEEARCPICSSVGVVVQLL